MDLKNKNKRVKFLLFVGAAFFLYLILYFPEKGEKISFSQMALEAIASIIMAFLVTYFSFWGINKINGSKE